MKSRSTLKRITLSAAIAAGFLGIGAANIEAATVGTWLPATGNWSDPLNWDTNPLIPSAAGDTAQYTAGVASIATVDTLQTVGTVSYSGTGDAEWGIQASTLVPLTFDQDGAGPGFATLINSNPNTGLNNRLRLMTGGNYNLADDLHIINSSASTNQYAIWLHGIVGGTGNVTFRNESNSLTENMIRVSGANTYVGTSLIQKGTIGFSINTSNFGPATNLINLGDASGGGQGSATLYGISGLVLPNPITVAAGSGGTQTIGFNQNTATAHGFSGVITLNDNLNLLSADTTVGNNVLLSGKITGTGGIILPATNTGAVRLSSTASDYTGNTTLNGGTLVLGNNSSPAIGGPVVSGPIGTGTLVLNGGTVTWNGGTTNGSAIITSIANPVVVNALTNFNPTITNRYLALNGAISGAGTIKLNSGVFSGTTLFVQGDISQFTGTFDFNTGVANSSVLSFTSPNATMTVDGSQAKFINNNTGGNRATRFGGATTLAGSVASTDAVMKMGELSGTTAAASIIGDATNSNLLEVGALGTNSTYAGYLRSAIALRKVGNGSLTLTNTSSGTASYSKGTTIAGGTLIAGGNAAPTATTPSLTGGVFGTPGILPILMNDNAAGNGTATTNANTGLLIGGAFTVSIPITVQNFGTGTSTIGGSTDDNSTFSGAIQLDKSVNLTSVAITPGNMVTVSGVVSGVGGLHKVGTGLAMLTGTNTYSGNTTVSAGTLTIEGTQSTSGNYIVGDVPGGATLNINNSLTTSGNLTIGEGNVHVFDVSTLVDFQNVINATGAGSLTVWANSAMISNNVRADVWNVDGVATIRANGGTAGANKAEIFNVGLAGKLNLKDNDLVVGSAGSVNGVRAQIVLGKTNNSIYGITSDLPAFGISTGFGYALGNDSAISPLLAGSLTGQTYDADSVLVKYTFLGDADLDGDSDLNDLGLWAAAFTGDLGNPVTPVTFWTSGDFDYDGDTDLNDLGFWASTFTGDLGGGAGSLIVNAPNAPAGAISALNSMGITVVPEPSTFMLAGVGLAGLALLRKRRVK